jgi:hypothetical protein
MIRQAHTYLVGALSGVVVIGIAIAAFVVLVSAQVFHDLPIPALSSSDQKAAAVSQGKALTSPDRQAVATTGGVSTGTIQPNHNAANANAAGGGKPGATKTRPSHHQATPAAPAEDATGPAEVVETAPTTGVETGNTGSASGGGNTGASHSSKPSSNSPPPSSAPTSGNPGGGNTTSSSGSSGNSGGSSGTPTPTSGSGGSGGGTTGTSGGTTSTSPPATPVTTAKPSEAITETVNGTVGAVDEAVGGTLGETGVKQVTEEVVNGAAGPESVVGKTVDGVGEVVGGLLGGHGE